MYLVTHSFTLLSENRIYSLETKYAVCASAKYAVRWC